MNLIDISKVIEKIQDQEQEKDVSIAELLNVLLSVKLYIAIFVFIGSLASVALALYLPNKYEATIVLVPQSNGDSGAMSSIAGQLGGLASVAGLQLPSGENNVKVTLETLKSREFLMKFIEKYDIKPELMAVKSWEQGSETYVYDEKLYNFEDDVWVVDTTTGETVEPSLFYSYQEFRKLLTINQSSDQQIFKLTLTHYSPYDAAKWLDLLVVELNEHMKMKEMLEAKKYKQFLENEVSNTVVKDMQGVLYKLIEEQVRTIMFASVREEFAFKVIDPVIIPEEKSSPRRALIVIIGVFLSGFLAVFTAFAHYFSTASTRRKS